MSKKQLYGVILVLALVVLYLLFMPTAAVSPNPTPEVTPPKPEVVAPTSTSPAESADASVATQTVAIEGTFIGLKEAETDFGKPYYTMLLDDGTEVVRIDLRPLLGLSLIDPIAKLGVDRGTRVAVTGIMESEGFVVQKIIVAE